MKDTRKILALDPANKCGYAHTDGHRGVWQLPDNRFRLMDFKGFIERALSQWPTEIIAYEDASFGSPNPSVQASHNELRGIIKLIASEHNIGLLSYVPSTIKKYATGNGAAKKPQMIAALQSVLKIHTDDDNVADACWILDMAQNGYEPPAKAAKALVKRVAKTKRGQPKLFR